MAKVRSINIDRIIWCCKDRGVSTRELADEIGLTSEKLDGVLHSRDSLTVNQLKKLAKYFNRGILFFVEQGAVKEEKIRTPGFRTLTNDNPDLDPKLKSIIERAERQRQIFLSLKEDSDEPTIAKFNPPVLPDGRPEASATIVRQWLTISGDLSFSTYRSAVERKGVLVFRSNGYNGPWKIPSDSPVCGFSIFHAEYPIIFIRKQASESRQLFTLMHELGHLLLHTKSFVDNEDDLFSHSGKERVANAFAGYLLVPDEFLRNISDFDKPELVGEYDTWLKPYRAQWAVSSEVILRRLLNSHRLSQSEYEKYRDWKKSSTTSEATFGSRAYRYREPKHIFGDGFVKTVLDALHSKQITITRASTYLDNLKVADIHKLERVYNAF